MKTFISFEDLHDLYDLVAVKKNHKFRYTMVYKNNANINTDNGYFIRVKNRNGYLHFVGENPRDRSEVLYEVKRGIEGAVIWSKNKCERVIQAIGQTMDMELISVCDAIKNES